MNEPLPAAVAILAFPEASASVVFGLYDLFMSAGRDWGLVVDGRPGRSLFAAGIVAPCRETVVACNGVRIEPHGSHAEFAWPRIVCVPDVNVAPGEPLDGRFDDEVASLRRWYAGGATLASACSGAMLFAQAGLLDGHEATTHWAYCDVMRERHPAVRVRPQRALVVSGDGGRLVMAGAGTSWLDVALYLIARTAGVETAMDRGALPRAVARVVDGAGSRSARSSGASARRPGWRRSNTCTRCDSRRRSGCSNRATRRSRRSRTRWATRTRASSAGCSGAA